MSVVDIERRADCAVLTLNRPQVLNTISNDVLDALEQHLAAIAGDDSRALILTGAGRAFCAGTDLNEWHGDPQERLLRVHALVERMLEFPKPVVAALNGIALGGGFELAMRCRAIVAMRDAWMQFPEITLGILPGIGAMVVPYRRWPSAATVFHGMLRRAEKLDAARAHELGIVAELADEPHALVATAVARVHALAGRPHAIPDGVVAIAPLDPIAPSAANGMTLSAAVIALMDEAIREAAAAPTLAAALEVGYRAFGESACTAAAREGITAFGEHRPPDFSRTG